MLIFKKNMINFSKETNDIYKQTFGQLLQKIITRLLNSNTITSDTT